ncbi:Integrase [Chromobacterium vaccinii]|nr:Integrase [Chromobacterium vaccinii]QND90820.1 Integrase [Chromobacterium vaccinii]
MSDEQFSQLVFEAGESRAQLELVDLKAVLDEIPSTPQEIIQWLRNEAKEVLREDLGLSSGDVSELIMLRKQDLKTLISEGSGTPGDFMKLEAGLELLDAAAAKIDKHDSKPLLRLSEGLSGIASLVSAEGASGPPKGLGGAVKGHVDAVAADGPTFAELVQMYSKEQKLKGKWTDKTELENAAIYRTLTGLLPEDVPASALTRQDFLKVAELLDTYPSNGTKRYPGYTPLEMAVEGKKLDSKDVLSIRTRNKHTDRLSTVCKWAAQNGLILRNLAEGLGREEKGLASSARQPFTLEDVQRLFKAISDHKCVDPRKRDQTPKPFMYWMPVLAYYTGARVNELASLRYKDIVQVDGVHCFSITQQNDGENETKTEAGSRIVPIHPELIRLGFLEFAESHKSAVRLFDELERTDNGLGDGVSRWFNGHPDKSYSFRIRAGVIGEKLTFHSFRHTFATSLEQGKVEPITIKRLLGHTMNDDVTFGRYSKGINAEIGLEAIVSGVPVLNDLVCYQAWVAARRF